MEPAYTLPLATAAAGVLLLMGGALQALALQERLQAGALERLRREEDLLHSGAHHLLAALNGPYRCLLPLPLAHWESQGRACATPEAVAALKRAEVMGAGVQLLQWAPVPAERKAELELALEGTPGRARRRGRFRVEMAGMPPQAVQLWARHLAGALP